MTTEREDSVTLTNQLIHHPCFFQFSNDLYSSKCIKNKDIIFKKNQINFSGDNIDEYNKISILIRETSDFFVFVVFKLLERNIFISTHDVICVSEEKSTRPIHCDLIACNPKKKEIYIIVFCNNKKMSHVCYKHAVLIINQIQDICPPNCKILPMVLCIYDFLNKSSMRLSKKIRR